LFLVRGNQAGFCAPTRVESFSVNNLPGRIHRPLSHAAAFNFMGAANQSKLLDNKKKKEGITMRNKKTNDNGDCACSSLIEDSVKLSEWGRSNVPKSKRLVDKYVIPAFVLVACLVFMYLGLSAAALFDRAELSITVMLAIFALVSLPLRLLNTTSYTNNDAAQAHRELSKAGSLCWEHSFPEHKQAAKDKDDWFLSRLFLADNMSDVQNTHLTQLSDVKAKLFTTG
jgi:hypothetical protein